MDSNTAFKLAHSAPILKNKLNLNKLETFRGSSLRIKLVVASAFPLLLLADFNGGLTKLGFVRTRMAQEFKVKPDYITETVFVAHRQDVPEFKLL
eukprot:403351999